MNMSTQQSKTRAGYPAFSDEASVPVVGCKNYLELSAAEVKKLVLYEHHQFDLSWLRSIWMVKERCGDHPALRYMEAMYRLQRESEERDLLAKQREHEERQALWKNGGQQAHYIAKFGRYGGHHFWLRKGITAQTGMSCADRDPDPCWDEWALEFEDACPGFVDWEWYETVLSEKKKSPRCEYCGVRGCDPTDGVCKALLELVEHRWKEHIPPVPIVRDVHLLALLRARIEHLRYLRKKQIIKEVKYLKKAAEESLQKTIDAIRGPATHQMMQDADEHGEGSVNMVKKSNVIVTEQHEGDAAGEVPLPSSVRMVSSDVINSYPVLVDRPYVYQVVPWKTTDVFNTELFTCTLPSDFVIKAKNSPNVVPFTVHRYFRGDIVVRIQLNANKFMMGQLQVAWYYQPMLDENFGNRNNVACSSQTLHTLINAGTSNEGVLRIPYRYYKPMLEVGQREDKELSLNMGSLYIRVLNQLSVTSAVNNACYFSVFISLENSEFTGMLRSSLNERDSEVSASHQMEAAAAMVAASAVSSMLDRNRDNPTRPANPSYFCPQVAQSWCLGNSLTEDAYSLRLTHAQVPTSSDVMNDSFLVKDLVQRYGYVGIREWKSTFISGQQLWAAPAVPMFEENEYVKEVIQDNNCYILPPVSYLSNMFQYWRGTLKLRLDFVATAMHTGRLVIGYVPGDYKNDLTLDDLYSSPYVEFDLKEQQQVTFRVPFVSDKMYWPRYLDINSRGRDMYAPGYVYVFVLVPLALMDSLAPKIEFNVYWAGGEDFELVVPAQPTIGLSFNPKHIVPTTKLAKVKVGYFPHYTGCYSKLDIDDKEYSKGQSFAIFRYGPMYEHVTQMFLPSKAQYGPGGKAYYLKLKDNDKRKFMIRSSKDVEFLDVKVDYFLPWYDNDDVYILPCKSEEKAKEWCVYMLEHKGNYNEFLADSNPPSNYFYPYWDDDKDKYFNEDGSWEWEEITVTSIEDDFECVAIGQMGDNRFVDDATLLDPGHSVPSTGSGLSHFGENFNDLKDYTRRYQPYCVATFTKKEFVAFKPGQVLFSFPVLPQGLDLDIGKVGAVIPMANQGRDGHIPLLLAGYRYFRGSIRFRLVLPSADGVYFIQHIPFVPLKKREVTKRVAEKGAGMEDYLNHSYAYTVQARNINSVISFEVPFYLPFDSILLQNNKVFEGGKNHLKDYQHALSLGEVRVGKLQDGKGNQVEGFNMFQVAYSLGDDARPSVFQGFPPVVLTQDTPLVTASHQMLSFSKMNRAADAMTDSLAEIKKLDLNRTNEKVDEVLTSLKTTSESVNEIMSKVGLYATKGVESFDLFVNKLKESGAPQILIAALGQICQVINNPTPMTMAIAVGSFLLNLGLVAMEHMKYLTELLNCMFTSLQPKHLAGADAPASPQTFDKEDGVALASVLFMGVSTALNTKIAASSKFSKGIAGDLLNGVTAGCKDGSYFFRFFSNVLNVLLKIFEYIRKKVCPETLGLENLMTDAQMITTWAQECIILTDVQLEPMFDCVPALAERVHAAYIVGSLVMARLASAPRSVNIVALKDLYNKICTLRTVLADRGICSTVRREPFIVCMRGNPGIGKSQMAHKVILNLLIKAGIEITTNPIYTHPPGAKYWDNLNQEHAMFMDDSLILRSGETSDAEIATLMSLKSTALFTPPIAECDRKKKRYAPELVYMHVNQPFPEVNNMQCPEALYRRRDMLWECALVDPDRPAKSYSSAELDACIHLKFRLHKNPADKNLVNPWSDWYSYDTFFNATLDQFRVFRNKMIETHSKKISHFQAAAAELAAYPELVQMPLLDILKSYSKHDMFPDLSLYRTQVEEIVAKQQMGVSRHEIIMKAMALESSSENERKVLGKTLDDQVFADIKMCCNFQDIGVWQRELRKNPVNEFFVMYTKSQLVRDVLSDVERCLKFMADPTKIPTIEKVKELLLQYDELCSSSSNSVITEVPSNVNRLTLETGTATIGDGVRTIQLEEDDFIGNNVNKYALAFGRVKNISVQASEYMVERSANTDYIFTKDNNSQIAPDTVDAGLQTTQKHKCEDVDAFLRSFEAKDKALAERRAISVEATVESIRNRVKECDHVCDFHVNQIIKDCKLEEIQLYRSFGMLESIKMEEYRMKLKAALSKFSCPHYYAFLRKNYIITDSTCCMRDGGIRHWCASAGASTCDPKCYANESLPILDDWNMCDGRCIRDSATLLSTFRMLYIKAHPGTAEARLREDTSIPLILFEKRLRERLCQIKRTVIDALVGVKDWICEKLKQLYGYLEPVRNFLGKYKYILLGCLGAFTFCAAGVKFTSTMHAKELSGMSGIKTHASDLCHSAATSLTDAIDSTTTSIGTITSKIFSSTPKAETDFALDPLVSSEEVSLTEAPSGQIIPSGDPRAHNVSMRTNFVAKTISNVQAINPRAAHQMAHEEVIAQRIVDNTIHLVGMAVDADGKCIESTARIGRALALGNRFVLTVKHAWEVWESFGLTTIRTLVKDRHVDIRTRDIVMTELDDSSLVLLKMPCNFPQFKRITQFFASELDHQYRCPSDGQVITCGTVCRVVDCKIEVRSTTLVIEQLEGATRVEIAGLYEYKTQGPGMCGSLLLGNRLNSPIIGMHIAGHEHLDIGYAEPLFRETFAPLFNDKITDIVEPDFFPVSDSKIDLNSTIFPVGSVGRAMAHSSPVKSAIHNSAIHGYVPPTTAPAPLSASDERLPPNSSPLIKGCEKHGHLTQNFHPEVLERTKERLRTHLFAKCKPLRNCSKLILSDQQAVCGDPQLVFCDPLKWNSSEGYPFCNFRPANVTDKKWLFKLKESSSGLVLEGFNPLLGNILEFKRNARADGIVQPTIFVDCLKDARIAIEKCSIPGKTRIFSMSPVDYTIEFRKYFYDFIASYQDKRFHNFNAIGINVFSTEWDALARSLLRHPNICTGDYSNFGPGLNEEVARICMDIILEWYDEFEEEKTLENQRTRACLAYELIGALHLCNDLVYKVVAGIPSGSPITVVLNSLVNTFYLFAAWDMLSVDWPIELRSFENFEKHIVLYTYGDDFIFSVSDLYKDLFNSNIIAKLFVQFDIKMTDAFKGATVTAYSTLGKSTFLKGSFIKYFDQYWYGLDKDQIYDMVNFVSSKHNKVELTKVNANMALIHAHGWGKSFFNTVREKLINAFSKREIAFQSRTFMEITDLKRKDSMDPDTRKVLQKLLPIG